MNYNKKCNKSETFKMTLEFRLKIMQRDAIQTPMVRYSSNSNVNWTNVLINPLATQCREAMEM